MTIRTKALGLAAAMALPFVAGPALSYELTVPLLTYRTGPYAPSGIPVANAFSDYFTLLNEKYGGIEGAKINYVECETAYNTQQGVECYENVKNMGESGALVINPFSTGITYQLIPKASEDKIPILSMGYGRTSAADGSVFPYIFNLPAHYWSGATVIMKYIAEKEGGQANMKGKKVALVYHNSAYGKEPIRTLETIAKDWGYELMLLPVDHPGQEQKATWLQIRRDRPDWVVMWGWGVMNQVAVKEAASIRYPMDRFIGIWWSGSENDVLPAGKDATGYQAATFNAPGTNFPLIQEILTELYDKGKGAGEREAVGDSLYNRGLLNAVATAEGLRTAIKMHGTVEIRGEQARDGFENLVIDNKRWEELGLGGGFAPEIKIACNNHEGSGAAAIQQWNAETGEWTLVTDWIQPMTDVIQPLLAADAEAYAKENNITPRDCK
ncbi:MAG: ABC transporter substrate-binding protein [Alphaproteobacteria bacterium]|nr:ABC transporter substrate-binding protein [Alphaproteobacteria bacterium]MDX5369635.1 ABC transporter substrate-binding protein [Alphaproteobacteria bacterium]MDX5464270.1 ABC transporter substrate-binding protein [Alphaproteobacteria bacterium]